MHRAAARPRGANLGALKRKAQARARAVATGRGRSLAADRRASRGFGTIESNAAYIVSEDRHLLGLKEYEGIAILNRDEFAAVLDHLGAPPA